MNDFKDDRFLARWLSGELSEEELAEFRDHPDYARYQKIVSGTDQFLRADFDQERLLEKIQDGIGARQPVTRSISPAWVYSAAASAVVLLGFVFYAFFLSDSVVEIVAETGEKRNVELPDGSAVIMNAGSTLSYNEDEWEQSRLVKLQGEAYFRVVKGSDFTVASEMGEVTVLGTQFNVKDRGDYYEVACFEGSVRVEVEKESEILKPKRGVRKLRGRSLDRMAVDTPLPSWVENRSTFKQVPVAIVLRELSHQYGVVFDGQDRIGNATYTGGFPHDDLEKSLKLVFGSLGIDYQLGPDKVVTLKE